MAAINELIDKALELVGVQADVTDILCEELADCQTIHTAADLVCKHIGYDDVKNFIWALRHAMNEVEVDSASMRFYKWVR